MLLSGSAWIPCSKVEPHAFWSWGSPSKVALDMVPPRGMLSTGSGEGCHLLGLVDCSDAGTGGAAGADCCSAGRSLLIRWMVETGVPAPRKCDRKLPAHLWAPLGWYVGQPDRWRGSQFGFCLSLRWLVPPGLGWFWHVAWGMTLPKRPPRSWHPWWPQSKWFQTPRWCRHGWPCLFWWFGCTWPLLPWQLRSTGPQHPR